MEKENSAPGKAERVLQDIVQALDETLKSALIYFCIPHWFDDAVLQALQKAYSDVLWGEAAKSLETMGLVETWSDGSHAVSPTIRCFLLDKLADQDRKRFNQLSEIFANIFKEIAPKGDIFDHIESVFHRLVCDQKGGALLLFQAGIDFKSEPLFAYDLLGKLVHDAQEQRQRHLLGDKAQDVLEFLELFVPSNHRNTEDESTILGRLLEKPLSDKFFEAEVLLRFGLAQLNLGNTDKARASFEKALSNFKNLGLLRGQADAQRALGRAALKQDKMGDARRHFQYALNLFTTSNLKVSVAHCVKALAETALYEGDFTLAETLFQSALTDFIALDGALGEANTSVAFSQLLAVRAQFDAAFEHLKRACAIYEGINNGLGIAHCKKNHGVFLFEQGHYASAKQQLEVAAAEYQKLGSSQGDANCEFWIAACEIREGQAAAALHRLDRAAQIYEKIGDRFGQASTFREQGVGLSRLGDYVSALAKLTEAEKLFAAFNNFVEKAATRMLMARTRTEAGDASGSTRSTLLAEVETAQEALKHAGYARYLREADELISVLKQAA